MLTERNFSKIDGVVKSYLMPPCSAVTENNFRVTFLVYETSLLERYLLKIGLD